mmetsp:Transcript_47159/g.125351  ORF Transcript_47159/g.125351 Transcript_47159/m.125351 type:complete len:99 (-) Transcript_47159:197-493(-)|eukprot:CAMPEP_0113679744 /NCGR_PEP_ID=MMETSP0038_2-20120614/10850_1 /TAXON_ID=2898 /ORGANISM="Cryptomonas paramecium" /LENGTH=98 /DNA_ID=CAMNT_0000597881 /DNA_START=22 /DNA_END=318 /DNA_ORIENTATION=+ /assembly_acc=CAM_ASM_000170
MLRAVANWYKGSVEAELKKYGLKYHDILIENHPDVDAALDRLTPEELSERNRRLKRAMDIGMKHSELSHEAQEQIKPWEGYLQLDRVRKERLERLMNP